MSQVKRYDIETDGFGNFSIGPDTSGRYVTFEDYAAMEQCAESALAQQRSEVDKANALIDDLREERNFLQRLAGERGGKLEAAEAKLTELDKQKAIGKVVLGDYDDCGNHPDAKVICLHDQADWENFQDGTELFLRPVPAVKVIDDE